ncbi:MAG: putative LPS assembly protein LptD, partial [Owenweeksia sp.]
ARNGVQHNIPITANYKVFKFFVLSPGVNYKERWYFNRAEYSFNDSLNQVVRDTVNGFYAVRDFSASTNLTTKLYGLWRYNGYLRAIRHVMTPTVGLSYRPDFSVEKWGYYQRVQSDTAGNFSRLDRYQGQLYQGAPSGKSASVNFGVQNTLEAKVRDRTDSSGVKKIRLLERFSLNTSYNAAVQEFNWSPLQFNASSSAFKGLINLNYASTFDFYGFDPDEGNGGMRVNKSAYEVNGKWLRPTNQTFTTGINLSANRFKKTGKDPEPGEEVDKKEGLIDSEPAPNSLGISEGDPDYYRARGFVDFNAPWTLNINYNLRKSYTGLESRVTQSIDFSGDVKLTDNWKVGFRSGYDFQAKDFTYTTLDFYRDLHCWELRCTWVPFGFQQSYTLTIRVKADVLSDLKMERRRGVGDFER